MSFGPIKSGGYAVGDPVTSGQMNAINNDIQNALDKAGGDTITGNVLNQATITIDSTGTLHFNLGATISGFWDAGSVALGAANAILASFAGAIAANIAGGIESQTPGGIKSTVAGGVQLAGGSGDWVAFSPSRAKNFSFGPKPCNPSDVVAVGTPGAIWTYGSFGGILTGNASNQNIPLWIDNPHNGATLSNITVVFAVGQAHGGVPANLPSISVNRRPLTPGVAPIGGQALSTTANQGPATPVSGTAWYSSNEIQSFTYTCDQNNVIDNLNYIYYLTLTDENGANALSGNQYLAFAAAYTNIADSRFAV